VAGSPNPPVGVDADIDALLGETIRKVGPSPKELEASRELQAMLDAARAKPAELVDPRTLPVRHSRLKAFALSPAHYLLWCQDQTEETLALRMGSAVHGGLLLGRDLVCYDGRRAGKKWERFEAHHKERGAIVLSEEEYSVAHGVVDAVRRHPRAMELLFDGTVREQRIDWAIGDRACRSTPDAANVSPTYRTVVDLKSARSTEPRWFAREALKRYYHAQLAFYDDALEHEHGRHADEHFIVAVENVAPFNVVVLRIPDATRLAAQKLNRLWWEQLLLAEATNTYGGYVTDDIDLELPDYDQADVPHVVEIDGKHVFTD
jgi:hypothetical protein